MAEIADLDGRDLWEQLERETNIGPEVRNRQGRGIELYLDDNNRSVSLVTTTRNSSYVVRYLEAVESDKRLELGFSKVLKAAERAEDKGLVKDLSIPEIYDADLTEYGEEVLEAARYVEREFEDFSI